MPVSQDMCHTLRNCRDFKHSSGMTNHSSLYHLPHLEEGLVNLDDLSNRKGRRWSIPSRRRRGQRHLRRTRVAKEQKATEAQRPADTGGNHQYPRPLSVVGTPDHLYPGRSMAQFRSSGQVTAPRRSSDPREQGKESISGRGKQHQRHFSPGNSWAWELHSKSSTSRTLLSSALCRSKENTC
jgi:hypothetical protein